MRVKINIWPSVADLFGALVVFTLGGIMVASVGIEESKTRIMKFQRPFQEAEQIMDSIKNKLEEKLKKSGEFPVRQTPEGLVIDIRIHFSSDSDVITNEDDIHYLTTICKAIVEAWNEFEEKEGKSPYAIIRIEGHSDSVFPKNADSDEVKFLYNWNLSARRATRVVYEFKKTCGLEPPKYPLEVVGFGSFKPLKFPEVNREDRKLNRRIEIKIIPDYSKMKD